MKLSLDIPNETLQEFFYEVVEKVIEEKLKTKDFVQTLPKESVKQFLTRKEAAGYLKISLPSLENILKSGKLASYKIGRRILISQDELVKFVESSNA